MRSAQAGASSREGKAALNAAPKTPGTGRPFPCLRRIVTLDACSHHPIVKVGPPQWSCSGARASLPLLGRHPSCGLTRMASRRIQKQVSVWHARTGRALFAMRAGILYRARRCNGRPLGRGGVSRVRGVGVLEGTPNEKAPPVALHEVAPTCVSGRTQTALVGELLNVRNLHGAVRRSNRSEHTAAFYGRTAETVSGCALGYVQS